MNCGQEHKPMQDKRYIICGNAAFNIPPGFVETALRFHLHGSDDDFKVTLNIADIHRSLYRDVPTRFHDLLEIATYVYCADHSWPRGQRDADTFGANWRRHFHFVIPVEDTAFWNRPAVKSCLADVLGFLSDDLYEFDFVGPPDRPALQQFLSFNEKGELLGFPEQVLMFSGGLDSLGGAVEEIVNRKRRVVLVNHRSSTKLDKIYRRLAEKLDERAPECPLPYHVRVTIHKKKWMNKDYMQRGRSFLYACIGATIARMLGQNNVRFYENGVISMNLPIAAQVVGGKATRTTHPRVIHGFQRLLEMVAGGPFVFETPFILKTKGEVVKLIADAGCQDMIADSISCTHTWEISTAHPHCGTCSQCVDRRFAVLAAGVEEHDPLDKYLADVFTDVRTMKSGKQRDEDRLLYAGYLERSNEVEHVRDVVDLMVRFPETARVINYLPGQQESVARQVLDLYKRHAAEVKAVMKKMFALHAQAIFERTLPATSLMRMAYESHLPVSAPAVPVPVPELPPNVFRYEAGHWMVRFRARKAFTLPHLKGADYLCRLLSSPHEAQPAVNIMSGAACDHTDRLISLHEAVESGLTVSSNPLVASAGNVSDWRALREYRRELRGLAAQKEEAERENRSVDLAQMESDMAILTGKINEALGLGGRQRQAQDKRKSIRDSFRNAVNLVIKKIRHCDEPLADHLKTSIRFGNAPQYQPREEITWETQPLNADN
jgi:hypothetical protein